MRRSTPDGTQVSGRVRRGTLRAVLALTLALGFGMATALPSRAASETMYAHTCRVVADDGITQGVFCVDIMGEPYYQGQLAGQFFALRVEAICQYDTGQQHTGTTQCANVSIPYLQWEVFANSTDFDKGFQDGCGHGFAVHPNCVASGRNYFDGLVDQEGPFIAEGVGGCYTVWGTLFANQAQIELPVSAYSHWLTSDLSTPHVQLSGNGGTC
jgi:hypothetical protein